MHKHLYSSLLSLFLLFGLGSLSAQTFTGKINPLPDPVASVSDTIRILAVMVEFQQDQDAATYGNGKFGSIYSKNYGTGILDPLPHDQQYFENHLEFTRNYFRKVSNGKAIVTYKVLPDIVTVAGRMRNYSPGINSNDLSPLGILAKEVWHMVDSMYPGTIASGYDVFTIFHAGVGRDVSITGGLGADRDLPSVYLSDRALRNMFPASTEGLPLNRHGKFNTMIIPETENREISGIGGTALLELSINGLIVASIASHLGLPDLFDTKTGLSAIGRFGLMDGQSIFAYAGTFPPEPSPWEKMYLGWAVPQEVPLSSAPQVLTAGEGFYRIPISSTEYYLVENRIRDANNDGAVITYTLNGAVRNKYFPKDTTGFYSWGVDVIDGVVTDVDEFDWAVPGSGIVIWHIDENVIAEKLQENQINTDKSRRGVDIEEADGIQDIGEKFTTVFGDEVVGEGSEEDLWYRGNKAVLYKNRFDKSSRPAAVSNTGASSLVRIYDFSEISNNMTFTVSFGDSLIQPVTAKKLPVNVTPVAMTAFDAGNGSKLYSLSGTTLHIIDQSGNITETAPDFSNYKPAVFKSGNTTYVVGVKDKNLNVLMSDGITGYYARLNTGSNLTAPPVVRNTSEQKYEILLGADSGNVKIYTTGTLPNTDPELIRTDKYDTQMPVGQIAAGSDYYALYAYNGTNASIVFDSRNNRTSVDGNIRQIAVSRGRNNGYMIVALSGKADFSIISDGSVIEKFSANNENQLQSFSLSDIRQDGENYILFSNGARLEAYNITGASADNFPFTDKSGEIFTSGIISADFEGDKNPEVVASTSDGRVIAFDGGSGRIVAGFPISAGTSLSTVPVLYDNNGKPALAAVSDSAFLYVWNIGAVAGRKNWTQLYGDNLNSSYSEKSASSAVITSFFPKERVYNWPNPVYNGQTYIRYFVSEDSKINIKIFDLAGDFVAELNDNARGGVDNETTWNVDNIQSGVYLARVEATGNSGKKENNVIKIAVIK